MIKKICCLLLLMSFLCLCGCEKKINQDDNIERIYLSEEFYNKGNFIKIKENDLTRYEKSTYILFVYNNYCSLSVPCEQIFQEVAKKYKIDFLTIPFDNFKNTSFHKTILYAPSIIIIENNKIIAYLDAEKEEDLQKYQDTTEFENWLNNYIYFQK